jgi:NADH dehydrogenase
VENRRAALTGATGLIGSTLIGELLRRGWSISALARRIPRSEHAPFSVRWVSHVLPDELPELIWRFRPKVFIHCGYMLDPRRPRETRRLNVLGARRIIDACRERDVRIVFISSMSAHDDAESAYGRSKLEIERMLDPSRDLVIRPGLVIGPGGLFRSLVRTLARGPFVPLFYGGDQEVQTIEVGELCHGIANAIDAELTGTLTLAEPQPVRLKELYVGIATELGRVLRFVQLPGEPTRWVLRMFETLGAQLPVTSENLLGLKHMRTEDVRDSLRRVKLQPTPWPNTLQRHSRVAARSNARTF